MVPAIDLRPGMAIKWNNDVCIVLERTHHTPGNKRAIIQVSMKSIRTGRILEQRFRSFDSVEQALLEPRNFNYLYSDALGFHFMNMEDWSQETLSAQVVGDAKNYFKENLTVQILFQEGVPIQVQLPTSVELKVAETAPGIKGDSVTNMMKPAKLESGLDVQVPLFVSEGQSVKIDTRTGKYLGRA